MGAIVDMAILALVSLGPRMAGWFYGGIAESVVRAPHSLSVRWQSRNWIPETWLINFRVPRNSPDSRGIDRGVRLPHHIKLVVEG
jgi:hypothetical protein